MLLLICTQLSLITKDVRWYAKGSLWTQWHKQIYCLLWKLTPLTPPLFFLTSRGPEAEKQMGLCNPRDPVPAHHHHHHCDTALSCVCDHDGQRHQDHGHLGGGHHPEEGEAVTPSWAGVSSRLVSLKLEDPCCPVPLINVTMDKWTVTHKCPLGLLSKAPLPCFSGIVSALACREAKNHCSTQRSPLWMENTCADGTLPKPVCHYFFLICWQQLLFKIYKNKIV